MKVSHCEERSDVAISLNKLTEANMRITNNMLVNNMMNNLGNNLNRMSKLQDQLATGKKITVPSDDPVVAARALKLRTDVSEIDQYQRNAKDAQSWMEITESTLSSIGDVMQRSRELAVQGSNGTVTMDDSHKIAAEIDQLKTQMIHLANATYAGRNIFSGYQTDKKLMEDDGSFAIDVNKSENISYEIGIGDNININVTGGDLFNAMGNAESGEKASMAQLFDSFLAALNTGDNSAVANLLGNFDNEMNNLLRVRADIGARTNRVELTTNRLTSDSINFTKLMSENEDVDMSETIMNLKNEENVYRASLSGGARIIQPTLVDFLR